MEDYFSIDDILAGEPKIYCTLPTQGFLLAHLDPIGVSAHYASNPELLEDDPDLVNHLPAHHRLALPYWLAESLAERSSLSIQLPRCFATKTRNALRADAKSVHLFNRCQAYYALGIRLAKLLSDVALPNVLVRAFSTRCWSIADAAVFAGGRGVEAMASLDRLERTLFFAAHGVSIAIRRWKERRADRIEPLSVLGKRKAGQIGSPVTPASRVRVR